MSRHPSVFALRKSVLALAVAGGGFGAAPALAQDERSGALEEIVVTAQRREESLQETPISITAFTEGKLQDLGVYDIVDIGEFAPNLQINQTPGTQNSSGIYIRGVGTSDSAIINDPKIGMYLDGVYISKAVGSVFDVVDLERIEVLRGPQGTLFGRNTTGGALNLTSKKPTGVFDLKAKASAGNYGYQRYGLSANLPEAYKLSTQISANATKSDGWADNDYDGPTIAPGVIDLEDSFAAQDDWAYRIALRWAPLESVTLDYSYDRSNAEGTARPNQLTAVRESTNNGLTITPVDFLKLGGQLYQEMAASIGNPNKRLDDLNADGLTEEWTDITAHSATAAWDVNDSVTLKYIFGYRYLDNGNTGSDTDGGVYYAPDLWYGGKPFGSASVAVQTPAFQGLTTKNQIDARSHELQLLGNLFEEKLSYTAGLYYFEETTEQHNPQSYALPIEFVIARPPASAMRPLYRAYGYCATGPCIGSQRLPIPASDPGIPGFVDFRYGQDSESWAAYAQASYSVTEALELTAGIRYTEDEKDAWLYNQNVDTDPTVVGTQAAELQTDDNWNNTSYLVNASYQLTDDVNAYLRYSTGYNAGGFNGRASTVNAFNVPYNEEEVAVWELGLKSEWLDQRLRVNAAVFSNDYKDIQIQQFEAGTGGASTIVVNAGAGTYEGFELEVVAVPVDGLTIDATYGYLDAQYNDYDVTDPISGKLVDIASKTKVSYVPDNSATAGVQYDFEPFSFGALSVRIDATYRSKMVFHPYLNEYNSADSYHLLNGRVSLNDIKLDALGRDGALRLSLWGKNLTDEEYRNFGIDFGSLGFATNAYGTPRTYGLDLVYEMR